MRAGGVGGRLCRVNGKRPLPKNRNNKDIGQISNRYKVLFVYLLVLHIMVMASWGGHSVPQCPGEALQLP